MLNRYIQFLSICVCVNRIHAEISQVTAEYFSDNNNKTCQTYFTIQGLPIQLEDLQQMSTIWYLPTCSSHRIWWPYMHIPAFKFNQKREGREVQVYRQFLGPHIPKSGMMMYVVSVQPKVPAFATTLEKNSFNPVLSPP